MKSNLLRLGTRKSLLAWAQSSWVAHEIESLNPGLTVELVGIETRGDRVLDVPLSQVEGKEFFVAELDDALKSRRVDFSVHSMKDLSLDRPAGFTLAAIPAREDPRDIVFFSPGIEKKLRAKATIRVGTSSPRRLENIPGFLRRALPRFESSTEPKLQFAEIRGNVNTRLGRIHLAESHERHLDGVVLALAGIARLWADQEGRAELGKLFQGIRFMVLPLRENPTAAAQGALAIECRADDQRTLGCLRKLHDPKTESLVARERALLGEWGGGCHQRFGATAVQHPQLGELFFIRGKRPNDEQVDELRWTPPAAPLSSDSWDGQYWRAAGTEELLHPALPDFSGKMVFVAHWRALPIDGAHTWDQAKVWTSGTTSWFRLAATGLWVEGCAEGLGFDFALNTLQKPCLQLGPPESWHVLTHAGASAEWAEIIPHENIHATYHLHIDAEPPESKSQLRQAKEIYLSSFSQYTRLKREIPAGARLSCGPGRTAKGLLQLGLRPKVFPSIEEWRKWINQRGQS